MAIHQRHAHREVLGHAHQGVIDRRIAMGVILAQHLTDDAGTFAVGAVAGETQLVHRIKNAAMHGLEAVAGVRQGPAHDDAHRILHVGARHLVAQVDLDDPSVGIAGIVLRRISFPRSGWIRHAQPP